MLVAGLTGGIATGKSTVSGILERAGAIIIDADKIAFDAVKKGTSAWQQIVDHFGEDLLLPSGEIDRPALGDIVFKNPAEKQALNRIVHPFVFGEVAERLKVIEQQSPDAVVIMDVPLLIESGMHRGMSDVIVVYAPENMQLKRLMDRDALSEADAMARIRSQMPIEEKKALASRVIDNGGDLETTKKETLVMLEELRAKVRTQGRDGESGHG